MNIYIGILYGIIQGLTEFLPISSSGHLAIMPFLMNFSDPGVVFDLMMHLGTALAVAVYYQKELLRLISDFIKLVIKRDIKEYAHVFQYLVATIASVLFILILKPVSEFARVPSLIAFNMCFFGFLLWRSSLKKTIHTFKHSNFKHMVLIGLSQAIAIFPGVSRSGITMTMSRYLGYDQKESGDFSFLLSLPIILAGAITKIPELMNSTQHFDIEVMVGGVLSSFLVGLLTIHFFMKFIKTINFKYFFFYRLILGSLLFYLILF